MGYTHGLISWTDLSVPDVDGAKAFHTALMGWKAVAKATEPGGPVPRPLFDTPRGMSWSTFHIT